MKLIMNRLTMTGLTSDMTTITLTLEWRERPNKHETTIAIRLGDGFAVLRLHSAVPGC